MLARYALVTKKPARLIPAIIIFLIQFYGTLIISENTADMLITVGGDAMGLIFATLLMVIFYLGKDTQLYKGSLRWGFWLLMPPLLWISLLPGTTRTSRQSAMEWG